MKTLDPYVKLVGMVDGREHAWRVSRPALDEEDLQAGLNKVYEMDLSLNSLKVFILEFRASTIFRDMVFSLRPLDGWALSTRSLNLTKDSLSISSEFNDVEGYESGLKMIDLCDKGHSRDKTRDLLPTTTSTLFTVSMNGRVLISFCKSIEELNPRLFDLYCKKMLEATGMEDEYIKSTIKPVHPFLQITDNERLMGVGHSTHGEEVVGYYKVKLALASQFLRQHYAKVKIGYWNNVSNYFNYMPLQSEEIEIVFYTNREAYHGLMSMRCHWALDWSMDMWGGIASDYIKDMRPSEFWDFLPYSNKGGDPYWADVYNRVLHADPGIPCPVMCEWPEMIERKHNDIGDSIILEKYEDLFKYRFIRDNPENIHRKKYLEIQNEI